MGKPFPTKVPELPRRRTNARAACNVFGLERTFTWRFPHLI